MRTMPKTGASGQAGFAFELALWLILRKQQGTITLLFSRLLRVARFWRGLYAALKTTPP